MTGICSNALPVGNEGTALFSSVPGERVKLVSQEAHWRRILPVAECRPATERRCLQFGTTCTNLSPLDMSVVIDLVSARLENVGTLAH